MLESSLIGFPPASAGSGAHPFGRVDSPGGAPILSEKSVPNQGLIKTGPTRRARPGAARAACGGATVLTLALFAACASTPDEAEEIPTAEGYYEQGLEVLEGRRVLLLMRDVNYPRAIELFQEVIDNYPYSDYATLAELKIADIYFEQDRFEEAGSYYQDFVELHPTHERVDYALYREGLCAFERMKTADRDQTATRDAIAQFQVLVERHPDSPYAEDALTRLSEATDMLAMHDVDVGDFYFDRHECHSAAHRYRQALTEYPDHSERLETMYRLGQALQCMRRTDEAIGVYRAILSENPGKGLAGDVRDRLEDLGLPAAGQGRSSQQSGLARSGDGR
jgi:outer membrane protein assembly factor BamD